MKVIVVSANLQAPVIFEGVYKLTVGSPPVDFFDDHSEAYLAVEGDVMILKHANGSTTNIPHSEGVLHFAAGQAHLYCGKSELTPQDIHRNKSREV